MKRIITLLIMILLISYSINAQTYSFKAETLIITDGTDTELFKSDVEIDLNLDLRRCVIYSREVQIIDYEVTRVYNDKDGFKIMECIGNDSFYETILFNIKTHITQNLTFITIIYDDLGYSYRCKIKNN